VSEDRFATVVTSGSSYRLRDEGECGASEDRFAMVVTSGSSHRFQRKQRARAHKKGLHEAGLGDAGRRTQSAPGHHHLLDQHGTRADVAAHFEIAAHGDDLLEHVLHVAGDGHFLNRELNFAVLDPETRRAT